MIVVHFITNRTGRTDILIGGAIQALRGGTRFTHSKSRATEEA